jgi:cell division protein FtsW
MKFLRGGGNGNARLTVEHSMLRTATLCLIALGAVMVYSSSSGTSLLSDGGDSSYYLKRYVASAAIGLLLLSFLTRWGVGAVRRISPIILAVGFGGLVVVLLPGFGVEANGAHRWIGAGAFQIQPSEIAKLSLILYAATFIASNPERVRSLGGIRPLLLVGGAMAALVVIEPDLGTAIVICVALAATLVASGVKIRHLAMIGLGLLVLTAVFAIAEPYRRDRLTSFLDPWADSHGAGFQSVQAMIAIGSGGPFGVGLGESVQKLFYLPEAHTDMILAVIGEELGFAGIAFVLFLYGMIAYAGLQAARKAKDFYSKLLAAGLTSLILSQATVNVFAVLGVLPLTGVPLPFISYGNSSLIMLLAAMGLLCNIAQQSAPVEAESRDPKKRERHLRVIESERPAAKRRAKRSAGRAVSAQAAKPQGVIRKLGNASQNARARALSDAKDRDRSRRDRRTRGAGAGDRRRAAG